MKIILIPKFLLKFYLVTQYTLRAREHDNWKAAILTLDRGLLLCLMYETDNETTNDGESTLERLAREYERPLGHNIMAVTFPPTPKKAIHAMICKYLSVS